MKLLKARVKDIVIQELESETLIYDQTIDKAYALNETSSIVFNACGNNQTFEDLQTKYNYSSDLINLALDELHRENLLQGEHQSAFANLSRREVIRKVGLATMVALPLIVGITAPKAINAASPLMNQAVYSTCTTPSTASTECASGRCSNTLIFTALPDGTSVSSSLSGNRRCCMASGLAETGSTYYRRVEDCAYAGFCCKGTGTKSATTNAQGNSTCTCD